MGGVWRHPGHGWRGHGWRGHHQNCFGIATPHLPVRHPDGSIPKRQVGIPGGNSRRGLTRGLTVINGEMGFQDKGMMRSPGERQRGEPRTETQGLWLLRSFGGGSQGSQAGGAAEEGWWRTWRDRCCKAQRARQPSTPSGVWSAARWALCTGLVRLESESGRVALTPHCDHHTGAQWLRRAL